MNGARLVHDELVAHGCELLIPDARKVKGLAPLACKTDKSAWTTVDQGADELPDGCPRPVEYVDLAHEPRISAGLAVHRLQAREALLYGRGRDLARETRASTIDDVLGLGCGCVLGGGEQARRAGVVGPAGARCRGAADPGGGRVAGSSRNRQPCQFVVVVDPRVREWLSEAVFVAANVRGAALGVAIAVRGGGAVAIDAGRAAQKDDAGGVERGGRRVSARDARSGWRRAGAWARGG